MMIRLLSKNQPSSNSRKETVRLNDSMLSIETNPTFNEKYRLNNLSPIKNSTTMDNFYNSTGVSSPTRTEQCLSLAKGSSSSFVKSFALTLAMLVVGVGSLWGQTTITLIDPATGGGFESGDTPALNGWTATVGTATQNQWVVRTATKYAGTNSAYITNARNTVPPPNAYTVSGTRVSHLYQNFTIPTSASSATLSFYWKATGESIYDYLRVYFEPGANAAPVYGTQKTFTGTAPTGIINAATGNTTATTYNVNTAGYGAYQLVTITVPASYFTGTAYRLTFEWRNDVSGGVAPPASVDNVSLTYVCPTPTCPTLSAPANAATGISQLPTLSWTAGANTNTYDVYLSSNQTDVNNQAAGALVSAGQAGLSYSPASLTASTTYYWRVVPKNSCGNSGSACTTRSFTTAAPVPTITVGALTAFGNQCVNTTSAAGSFTVSGINLTANVGIAALSGYSYCLTAGGTYTSTLSIPASGTLGSTPVYVKFAPTAASAYSGNIVASSTGATSVNVAASGTGVNTSISTQPSASAATYCPSAAATALTVAATAAGGSSFAYQWYSNASASTTGGTTVGTNSASYTPSTASNGTLYYYCVVSGCGTGATSTVSGAITTGGATIPYNEPFTTTSTPNCWNITGWIIGSTRGVTGNTGNNIYINMYSSATTGQFNTGEIGTVSSGMKLFLDYKHSNYSSPYGSPGTGTGSFKVQVSSNGGSSYTDLATVSNDASTAWRTLEYSLSSYAGMSVRVRIVATWVSGDWDYGFDNIKIQFPPAPSQPSAIVGTLDPEPGSTQTYSVTNVADVSYAWVVPSTWTITGGQGTNSITATVGTENGTISVTPSNDTGNGTVRTASTTIPNYRWKYISSNLGSATWTGGEARNISITIQNTGVATWNTTYPNNIGVRWNSTTGSLSGTPWSDYHVRSSVGSLAPGAQGTFTLAMEARNSDNAITPSLTTNLADGTYYLAFDMVSEGQCWFSGNTGTCGPGNTVFYSAVQTVSTVPTLSCSALTAFGNVCTNATPTNSFTISGVNLTNNVSVASVTGYTYSTTSNGTYTSTLTLTPSSGSLNQIVYVKFTPTAATAYSGSISVTSTGATGQSVSVSGTGIASPTVNAGSDFNLCSGQTVAMSGSTNATSSSGTASSGTVTASGNDNTNPTATYTFTGLPSGAVINGITVNITSAGGGNCPSWYSVTTRLNGVQQGVAGCATNTTYTNLNGQAANGLVVAVRGQDNDAYGDAMTITYTVSLSYYVGVSPNPIYAWSPATGLSATNVLNPNCSATTTTTYTLTVTGTNGCSASDAVAVTVAGSAPSAPTASVSGSFSSTINVGGTTTLTSSAGANTLWYTTASGGSSVGSGDNWQTPVECASGTETYYAEDNNGTCASASRTAVSFTVRPMILPTPNGLICQVGGSVTLSAQLTGGSGWTWSPNTNLSTTSGNQTIASPSTTTVYTMNATVVGCGAVSATQSVGVIDAVAFTPTSTPEAVCAGNTAALASNLSSSNFSVSATTYAPISEPGSGVTTLATGGAASVALSGGTLDDGGWADIPIGFTYNFFGSNYTTLAVGTNGVLMFGTVPGYTSASGELGQFSYSENASACVPAGASTGQVFPNCSNPANIIALMANDLQLDGGSIKYWKTGIAPTQKFVVQFSGVPHYTFSGVSANTVTVQCILFETTGNVEIHIASVSAGTGNNAKTVGLQNSTRTIGATAPNRRAFTTEITTPEAWKFVPSANYTFQWATGGSNIDGATSTGYTTANLNTPGTVSYSVAATNPNTQCTTTQSVSITVNALPSAPVSAGNVTECANAANQNLVVSVGSGETADWYAASSSGSVLTSPSNGTGVTSYSVPANTTATYYAEARNSTTGCVSSSRTGVTFTTKPVPTAPTASAVSYCQGATSSAMTASTPAGSNTQNWYDVSTGGTPLAGAPTPSTSTATTLTYYVSEVGTNGCESSRTSVTATINATPSAPSASNPSAYCQNASASALTATSDGSSTLYWYTVPTGGSGSTTAITPSTSTAGNTDYYVAQRSTSNCESSRATITVTVNPNITASVSNSASSTSACGGGAITFTATPTNGGTPTYQWYLNGNPVGGNSNTYTTNQATDNATNYSGSWTNGSNQGNGMGAWSFTTGANTGQFIGNPSNDGNGTTGIGTTAHGIYASGSAYINTTRGLTTPMQIGDVLRFYWIFNWDANGGNKGFDLRSGGSTLFNVNNGGSAAITVTGGATADANYGTTPMYVEITRTSGSQYTFNMTRRSNGTSYSTTFNSASAIDAISFYIGAQNDVSGQRNLYFNGLEIRPPQANDQIYVAMTPSAQTCLTSASATNSNSVTLTSTASTPTVAIQSSAIAAICPGTSVTFSVNSSANMGATPSYVWKLNGQPILNATNATYTSTGLVNNDQITLTMTSSLNGLCVTQPTATSSAITTTVNTATSITAQPSATSACASGTANFTVTGAGQGTLTYQWKKNTVNITGNGTATSSSLTLSGVGAGDVADYTVVVTGACGSVTSNTAAFTINTPTAISAQPSAVTQCAGTTANFSVTGSGQGTLSYQWRKDGSALNSETNSTLAVTNIATINAGQYSVIVTGGCGNVTSSNALMTVNASTAISTQPAASTLCAGNTANFSVTASGTGALSYQWKRDGNNVGTNSSSLAVSNSQAENAGTYTVDVTGTCGIITSNNALLTVNPLTTITTQPVGTAGCEGQNTTFTVVAAGTGSLSYQWKYGATNVGTNSASYNIPSTSNANDGNYSVVVTGTCGNATSNTVALNVYLSPTTATISTADITNASLCGKNEVSVTANSPGAESTGEWSVVGNWGILPESNTTPSTTFTANNAALGGTPKKLVWSHIRNTEGNLCYTRDTITVDFKQPVITAISGVIQNGDVVWGGLTSSAWSTSDNWYQYQSGALMRMTQGEPTSTTKVYTLSNADAGACVSSSNVPALGNGEAAANVYVGNGASLNLSSGTLTIAGDLTNNGTINPSSGTVTFNGSGAQKIMGTGTVANFNNLVVNKATGTLTLEQPAKVAGTLTMTQGDIITDATNILEIGTNASSVGSVSWIAGTVRGPMKRWFSGTAAGTTESGIFPVGVQSGGKAGTNRYAQVNFSSNPGTGGYIVAEYKTGTPSPAPAGLPLNYSSGSYPQAIQNFEEEGYWDITPYSSGNVAYAALNSTPYTLKVRLQNPSTLTNGWTPSNDGNDLYNASTVRLIRSKGSTGHASWELAGTHVSATETGNGDYFITSSGITEFSWFNGGGNNQNPLPVELVSFTGACDEGIINLTWQTASEFNSSHFDVEKSRDGENWQLLTTLPSAGTSNELITYQSTDKNGTEGNNYFRLRQVDNDGKEKLYDPINVSCSEVTTGYFSSFPNPSGSSFQVIVNNKELIGTCTMNIVDATGKVIEQREIEVKDGINMFVVSQELTPGIYFLNISNGTKSTPVLRHAIK